MGHPLRVCRDNPTTTTKVPTATMRSLRQRVSVPSVLSNELRVVAYCVVRRLDTTHIRLTERFPSSLLLHLTVQGANPYLGRIAVRHVDRLSIVWPT